MDFNKRIRASRELAFERDSQIRFENVTLPLFGLIRIKVIRSGDGISALMLGKIHGGIRDLDQLLRC
jgi:hypothetical protein